MIVIKSVIYYLSSIRCIKDMQTFGRCITDVAQMQNNAEHDIVCYYCPILLCKYMPIYLTIVKFYRSWKCHSETGNYDPKLINK